MDKNTKNFVRVVAIIAITTSIFVGLVYLKAKNQSPTENTTNAYTNTNGNTEALPKTEHSVNQDTTVKIDQKTQPQNNTDCPMYAPAGPEWCSDGIIIPPVKDANGCYGHPTCSRN